MGAVVAWVVALGFVVLGVRSVRHTQWFRLSYQRHVKADHNVHWYTLQGAFGRGGASLHVSEAHYGRTFDALGRYRPGDDDGWNFVAGQSPPLLLLPGPLRMTRAGRLGFGADHAHPDETERYAVWARGWYFPIAVINLPLVALAFWLSRRAIRMSRKPPAAFQVIEKRDDL